uniref:Polyprotein n=1 Tax=Pternopetalum trichomanifolium cheravirus TaxID=3115785 RepID=A0AAT9JAT1_9SECO
MLESLLRSSSFSAEFKYYFQYSRCVKTLDLLLAFLFTGFLSDLLHQSLFRFAVEFSYLFFILLSLVFLPFLIMEAVTRSEQIRKDLGLGQLFSPEQMRLAIIAQAQKRTKSVASSEDGHIGTAGVALTKQLVFQNRANPILRGVRTLFTHGVSQGCDDILVLVEETTKMELVTFPGYVKPDLISSTSSEVQSSVATYTELPSISEEKIRNLLERGFKTGSTVAMDINIQSHIGQKTPLFAFCAIMDSYSNDFNESLQVGFYLNLAEGVCKALTVPLINYPLSYELDMWDSYIKRLYLVTYFYNSRGFIKGMPMFSYGVIGFSEFKPSINNLGSRVSLSWDQVQRKQLRGERVISGLNLITHVQKSVNVEIPDIPASIFKCREPLGHSSYISMMNNGFDTSALVNLRGGSVRVPKIDFHLDGLVEGRRSLSNPIVRNFSLDPNTHATAPHFSSCVAEGPDFTTIVYPTLDQGNLLDSNMELEAQISELYGESVLTLANLVPKSFDPEFFIGQQIKNYELQFLRNQVVVGTVLSAVAVTDILAGNSMPSQLVRQIISGNLALEVKAEVSLVKSAAFTLKLCYDESEQVADDAVDVEAIRPLPGVIFSSQETSGVFSFSLESLGPFVDLSRRTHLGKILLVAWSPPNQTTADIPQQFNCNIDIHVANLQSYTYSVAQGPICSFSHGNVHLTLDSHTFESNRVSHLVVVDVNPWEPRLYTSAFASITPFFEGYVADFILSWHLAISAFSSGKLYIFPVYDQQTAQNVSKTKLDQAGVVAMDVALRRSGKIRIPFHSWFGSYNRTYFPRVGFFAPAGISGPQNETGRLSLQIDAIVKFSGRGIGVRRHFDLVDPSPMPESSSSESPVESSNDRPRPYNLRNLRRGQSPYNYIDIWLHAATVTSEQFGNNHGVWHIPVSPFNMANRIFDDNGVAQFNTRVSQGDNWLHFMSRSHLYWRGSLCYQFRVNYQSRNNASHALEAYYSSSFQNISGFNNPTIAPTYSTSFCTGNSFVLDVEIPYYSTSKWLRTIPDARTDYALQNCFNGLLTFQLPQLPWFDIQVWVKPGQDFILNRFRLARVDPLPSSTNSRRSTSGTSTSTPAATVPNNTPVGTVSNKALGGIGPSGV